MTIRTLNPIVGLALIAISCVALAAPDAPDSPAVPAFVPPHSEQIAPGVFAAGFSHKFEDANCGWVTLGDHTLLVDLPRGIDTSAYVNHVQTTSGKPVRGIVLTSMRESDAAALKSLESLGVRRVNSLDKNEHADFGEDAAAVEFIPYGKPSGIEGGAIYLPRQKVLFAGPAAINGPHIKLADGDTTEWIQTLKNLQQLHAEHVVPGSGSWGGPQVLERERKFLTELRQQVAQGIAMGHSLQKIAGAVRLPHSYYVWMPYDLPTLDDMQHIYSELTIPNAPYAGHAPDRADKKPHALVLIGDRVHEPEHVEEGLRPVFDATGVVPHFTVDYRSITAENLAHVSMLVILRDGMLWPNGNDAPYQVWMTPDQESAVANFVQQGGAFLNLHNAMGLFPENGLYLKLVGGHYTGHGPLEPFAVEVADHNHPITRGVQNYFIADEQHTPVIDGDVGHVLLISHADDGTTAPAGWAYEPGKGRLVHLANGHTRDALNHPMFQLLMRNAVDWLLRRS